MGQIHTGNQMMSIDHPITPPPELVQQWWDGTHGAFYEFEAVTTQAARWGADQELEACVEHLKRIWSPSDTIDSLYTARRPKPPSLAEQALLAIDTAVADNRISAEVARVTRAALKRLQELENND